MEKYEIDVDPAAMRMCNSLTFLGFLVMEYGVQIAALDKVPPGLDTVDGYMYVASLISDLGLGWLRTIMTDFGHTMPDDIFAALKSEEERRDTYLPTNFPEVWGDFGSRVQQRIWHDDRGVRTGVILLECLRHSFPVYYDIVMKVLGGLLKHYGKTYGVPHYKDGTPYTETGEDEGARDND